MSDVSIIRKDLESAKIPYQTVHVTNDGPVVIVEEHVARMIASRREKGDYLKTLPFVSPASDGTWMVSYVDANGSAQFCDKVSECVAYRRALGFVVGHKKREGRYRGYYSKYRIKKRNCC